MKKNNKNSKFINKKSFWAIGIVLLALVVTSLSLYAKGHDDDDHGRYGGKMMYMMMGMDMYDDDALEKLDANGDGSISKKEHLDAIIAMVTEKAGEEFDEIDADSDGSITKEEFAAATEMMKKKKKKKRGKYGSKKSSKY